MLALSHFSLAQIEGNSATEQALLNENAYYCYQDSTKLQYYSNFSIRTNSSFCPELYCEIFDWIGIKYAYGRSTKSGTDCSGFVKNVTRELLGYELEGGSSTMYTQCEKVEREMLEEFDLVFFRIRGGRISHVGVYLQNGYFVHSSVQGGVMINHLDEPYYKKYFAGGGRVPVTNEN